MYWWLWLIYTRRDWLHWTQDRKCQECTNMGKVKRLELWSQLYVMSLRSGTYEISGCLIFVEQSVQLQLLFGWTNKKTRKTSVTIFAHDRYLNAEPPSLPQYFMACICTKYYFRHHTISNTISVFGCKFNFIPLSEIRNTTSVTPNPKLNFAAVVYRVSYSCLRPN
jgi:hypothetical protein